MPPCRFLTKKINSLPHQSSQLTEDTEAGGGNRKERDREGEMAKGKREKNVSSDVQSKRKVPEIRILNYNK